MYNELPVAVLQLDAGATVISQNKHALAMLGDVLQMSFTEELAHVDSQEEVLEALASTCGKSFSCMLLHMETSGKFPIFRTVRVRAVRDSSSCTATLVILPCTDSFETHQLDLHYDDARRLRDLEDFVDNAPIGLHSLSAKGNVLWANRAQRQLLGYSAEQIVGMNVNQFVAAPPEVLAGTLKTLQEGNTISDACIDWKTRKGAIRHMRLDSNVRFDRHGQFVNSRCFIRDDTAKHIRQVRCEIAMEANMRNRTHQDRFLRRLMHEFRTPCSNILQSIQPGQDRDGQLRAQVNQIVGILNDLRDAELFESGQSVALNMNEMNLPVALFSEVKSVFQQNEVPLIASSFVCTAAAAEFPLRVRTDSSIVCRVLNHLLENAFRFTDDRTSVRVLLEQISQNQNSEVCRVSILNSGPVLDANRVFNQCQRYYDCSSEDAQFTKTGLGLGLNVSHNLLQTLGWQLMYSRRQSSDSRSSSHGGGDDTAAVNVFSFDMLLQNDAVLETVALPPSFEYLQSCCSSFAVSLAGTALQWEPVESSAAAERHVLAAAAATAVQQPCAGSRDSRSHSSSMIAAIPEQEEEPYSTCMLSGPKQLLRRPHILVVDDNVICRRVLCRTLERLDCTTEVACDGAEAVTLLASKYERFDLIVMDLRMPNLNGLDATRAIRMHASPQHLYIVGFSADSGQEIEKECAAAGMNSFIGKPASAQTMKNLVFQSRKMWEDNEQQSAQRRESV
jgi:PAS domain S-box-containing protein